MKIGRSLPQNLLTSILGHLSMEIIQPAHPALASLQDRYQMTIVAIFNLEVRFMSQHTALIDLHLAMAVDNLAMPQQAGLNRLSS